MIAPPPRAADQRQSSLVGIGYSTEARANHLPQLAVPDRPHSGAHQPVEAIVEAFDQRRPDSPGRIDHGPSLDAVQRERLFAQHRLTGIERRDRPLAMSVGRQRHIDQVNIVVANQLGVITRRAVEIMLVRKGLRPRMIARRDRYHMNVVAVPGRLDQSHRRNPSGAQYADLDWRFRHRPRPPD